MISHTYYIKLEANNTVSDVSSKKHFNNGYAVLFHTAYTHDTYYFKANSWSDVISYLMWNEPNYIKVVKSAIDQQQIPNQDDKKTYENVFDVAELLDQVFQAVKQMHSRVFVFRNNCYHAVTIKPIRSVKPIKLIKPKKWLKNWLANNNEPAD